MIQYFSLFRSLLLCSVLCCSTAVVFPSQQSWVNRVIVCFKVYPKVVKQQHILAFFRNFLSNQIQNIKLSGFPNSPPEGSMVVSNGAKIQIGANKKSYVPSDSSKLLYPYFRLYCHRLIYVPAIATWLAKSRKSVKTPKLASKRQVFIAVTLGF